MGQCTVLHSIYLPQREFTECCLFSFSYIYVLAQVISEKHQTLKTFAPQILMVPQEEYGTHMSKRCPSKLAQLKAPYQTGTLGTKHVNAPHQIALKIKLHSLASELHIGHEINWCFVVLWFDV